MQKYTIISPPKRCERIQERTCGFEAGVIGKIPYAKLGCEWKKKIKC